jgi:hypothetical protein
VPWKEIAGYFDIDFGTVAPTPMAKRMLRERRGLISWIGDKIDNVKQEFEDAIHNIEDLGNGEISKDIDIAFGVGDENVETLLFEDVSS